MITAQIPITNFLGLQTHLDETNIPLGGALLCQNYAQYFPQRIQRIPGLTNDASIADSEHGFPHSFVVRIDGGTERLMVVKQKSDDTVKLWNLTDDEEVAGTTTITNDLSGQLAGIWTSAYYLRQQYLGNGNQAIQVITAEDTRVDIDATTAAHQRTLGTYSGGTAYVIGNVVTYNSSLYACIADSTGHLPTDTNYWTPTVSWVPPIGCLLKVYLGRLYIAGIDSPLDDQVWYSDPLTTDYEPTNFLNTDEIPGKVTALAVNSATTASTGILGELIIAKAVGLIKLTGDPESGGSKDVVSAVIGSLCPHTFVNTPVGLLFLGQRSGVNSVYFLPTGSVGEPIDVGLGITGFLNNVDTPLQSLSLSQAVFHDGMYKLFVNYGGTKIELWADIVGYIRDQVIRWYGPHTRGANQAPVVSEDGTLYMFEVSSGTGYYYEENVTKSTEFYNLTHGILQTYLDLPLNAPPENVDKSYDLFTAYFSKETNLNGNSIDYLIYSEGVQLGSTATKALYKSQNLRGIDASFPLVGDNGASFYSRYTVRIRLTHSLDYRSDITKMGVQFLYDEQPVHKAAPTS